MTWLRNASEVPALAAALRVPRLRILTACCPAGCAVVRVYQTTDGRIALIEKLSMSTDRSPTGPTAGAIARLQSAGHEITEYAARPDILAGLAGRSRGAHQGLALAASLDDPAAAQESFGAECACRQHTVHVQTLLGALARGLRRIVLD